MRRFHLLALTSLSAAALVAVSALPATAADTTTTFALTGGALSLTAQNNATLTGGASGVASASGQLGAVEVTDLRGGTANWSVNASTTKFTTGTLPNTNPTSTGVTYNSGVITSTGTMVIVTSGAQAINATPSKVAGPTALTGNNTASWNPTLTVALPSDALAGNYTGTVTTSVS